MKCIARNILTLLFLLALVGCKVDATKALERAGTLYLTLPQTTVYDVAQLGEIPPVVERLIEPASPLYIWCQNWLKSNTGGWVPTPASYVPNYVLSGKWFNLNIFESRVVFNFVDKNGKAHQYTKDFSSGDCQQFLELTGI
jgi:hypothetical protein